MYTCQPELGFWARAKVVRRTHTHTYIYISTEIKFDRSTQQEWLTGEQRDRATDWGINGEREKEKEKGKEKEKRNERRTDRQTDKQTERQTEGERLRDWDTETDVYWTDSPLRKAGLGFSHAECLVHWEKRESSMDENVSILHNNSYDLLRLFHHGYEVI